MNWSRQAIDYFGDADLFDEFPLSGNSRPHSIILDHRTLTFKKNNCIQP